MQAYKTEWHDVLVSDLDHSVNFVIPHDVGSLEARYVRRSDSYFIVYLSSQTGCDQGCRMCHLTATNQRKLADTTPEQFFQQASLVLDHYSSKSPTPLVHFNYMARGEPLNNQFLLSPATNQEIFSGLNGLALRYGDIEIKHIISTILPNTLGDRSLADIFSGDITPEIYYSLYSLNESFRKKWLPNALPAMTALNKLKEWQLHSGKRIKIHYAFIENENDGIDDVQAICDEVNRIQLNTDINVVRYNPYSDRYGRESSIDVINRNIDIFNAQIPGSKIQLVTKVGFDVKASCGMFVGGKRK